MPPIKEGLAQDRIAEIAIWPLNKKQISKIPRIPQIRQPVRVPAKPLARASEVEPQLGLPNQIKRRIGKRDVFLQGRGKATPLRNPVPQHQSRVAHPASKNSNRVHTRYRSAHHAALRNCHHICPTSSGMS